MKSEKDMNTTQFIRIDKIEGVSVLQQKDYVRAEHTAHEELEKARYSCAGYSMKMKKVVVFEIENENRINERRKVHYFKDWQDAYENLVIDKKRTLG